MENIEKIDWTRYFDRIWCIHYLPFKDRVARITSELERVGILYSGIFSWKFTYDSPFYGNLMKSDISLHHVTLKSPPMLKCTLAHYSIYKESLGIGFNRILVLEDDVVFLKDLGVLKSIMDDFPSEYDVVMLDKWPFSREYYARCLERKVNGRYCEFDNSMSSGAAYSLDRRAMEFVVGRQEASLHAGDTAWLKEGTADDGIRRCFSVKNACIQVPYSDSYTEHVSSGAMGMFYSMCGVELSDYV